MGEYDIYLNGKGYHLAKDPGGNVLSGAAREQIVDPFTRYLSADEPYTRVPFRFGDGAGLTEYDGSPRYEWGNCADARSGNLLLAPKRKEAGVPYHQEAITGTSSIVPETLQAGTAQHGIAQRFKTPTGPYTTVRSLAFLVKRDPTYNYAGANPIFRVAVAQDAAGPKPGASVQFKSPPIVAEADPWLPFPDRWRNDGWFWLEVTFDADAVIGADTWYWILIYNAEVYPMYWAEDQSQGTIATRSVYNGTSWSNGAADYPMMLKLGYKDGWNQFDSFIRCFQVFRGSDKVERIYAGTNFRVMTCSWGTFSWTESKTIGAPVLQMIVFNSKMFAACGTAMDFWYSDGSTFGSTAWTQVSGQQSNAFAVHDNMLWKADNNVVNASADGLAWTAPGVTVGDPGTPVQSMTSHGGKLFAAKPEGVFEINYPDTYPGSGTPTANLMLDFSTERCTRNWLLDWHSGLYFPGLGGVYELKNGVLRNLWEDKVDEGALDALPVIQTPMRQLHTASSYTRPRTWAALYDRGPVGWMWAYGTTRGILFSRSNPHTETSDLIWYDGRNWYSIRAAGAVDVYGQPDTFGEYVTAALVHDAGGGRGWLWFAEGFGISRLEWPTWTDSTVDDGQVQYTNYGAVTTPWFSLPERSKEMLFAKIGLISQNLNTPSPLVEAVIYYRTSPGGSWISMGTYFTTSPYQEVSFPTNTKGRRIQFRITLYTSNAAYTPILEQLDLFYQTLPEQTKTHQLIISCKPDQDLREAGLDERTANQIATDLRALVGNTGFTYIDPLGNSRTVRVTAITNQTTKLITGPGAEGVGAEAQAIVNLLEV